MADHAHHTLSAVTRFGPHDDVYVTAERIQEPVEPFHGEAGEDDCDQGALGNANAIPLVRLFQYFWN